MLWLPIAALAISAVSDMSGSKSVGQTELAQRMSDLGLTFDYVSERLQIPVERLQGIAAGEPMSPSESVAIEVGLGVEMEKFGSIGKMPGIYGSDELRERRLILGLSQKKFSEQTGLSIHQVRKLERGEKKPTEEEISILSRYLGIEPAKWQPVGIYRLRLQGPLFSELVEEGLSDEQISARLEEGLTSVKTARGDLASGRMPMQSLAVDFLRGGPIVLRLTDGGGSIPEIARHFRVTPNEVKGVLSRLRRGRSLGFSGFRDELLKAGLILSEQTHKELRGAGIVDLDQLRFLSDQDMASLSVNAKLINPYALPNITHGLSQEVIDDIDKALKSSVFPTELEQLLGVTATLIDDTGKYEWSLRVERIFAREGILTFEQLARFSAPELLRMRDFSRKCLNEVNEMLEDRGLRLRQ